jgi:hypothetical protein
MSHFCLCNALTCLRHIVGTAGLDMNAPHGAAAGLITISGNEDRGVVEELCARSSFKWSSRRGTSSESGCG